MQKGDKTIAYYKENEILPTIYGGAGSRLAMVHLLNEYAQEKLTDGYQNLSDDQKIEKLKKIVNQFNENTAVGDFLGEAGTLLIKDFFLKLIEDNQERENTTNFLEAVEELSEKLQGFNPRGALQNLGKQIEKTIGEGNPIGNFVAELLENIANILPEAKGLDIENILPKLKDKNVEDKAGFNPLNVLSGINTDWGANAKLFLSMLSLAPTFTASSKISKILNEETLTEALREHLLSIKNPEILDTTVPAPQDTGYGKFGLMSDWILTALDVADFLLGTPSVFQLVEPTEARKQMLEFVKNRLPIPGGLKNMIDEHIEKHNEMEQPNAKVETLESSKTQQKLQHEDSDKSNRRDR